MRCPTCGSEVPGSGGRCQGCGGLAPQGAAVLTPPPLDEQATVFAWPTAAPDSPTVSPVADAQTLSGVTMPPPPGAAGTPTLGDDSWTRLATDTGDTTGLPPAAGGVRHVARPQNDTGPLGVGQQFSSRYLIIRLLGIGGMGAVYQTWDAVLGVPVALKIVRPEVTRDPAAALEIDRRFKQELLLARQVTHKNVVRIHDMGEIGGIKYITMPYVDGEDLATRLRRETRLPVAAVMPIARQIAAGLQAAHEAGIVHRDLKPANVMLDKQGQAIIMDFGIARTTGRRDVHVAGLEALGPLEAAIAEESTRLADTKVGAVVGTVAYMAPEQARGQDVDQRADIYAFGLMLYDMLTGPDRTRRAGGAVEELQKRLEYAPLPVRALVPEIPDGLDRLVSRCVQPDPAARFQTTADLVAALEALTDDGTVRPIRRVVGLPLMAGTIGLLLVLAAGSLYYQRQFIPPPQHDPVSVLIADVANTTGDAAFDRTLEPVMRRALEDTGFVSAYDRGAMRTLGVRPPDVVDETTAREIAVKQGLGVVLTGAIAPAGGGYAVSVKAVQAVTGNVIADARGRAGGKDQVLPTATRLIATVRAALGDDASESDQLFRTASMSATSLDVVRLYAAGREAASNNRYEEARRQYARAIQVDPKFGIGYQALAAVSLNLGAVKDAERYAQEALSHLDGMTQREVYSIRGLYYLTTGDYPQCVKEYGDLIAAYPADVAGHNNLALCSTYLRDLPKALGEMRRVVTMLPKRDLYRVNLALYSNYAGEFQDAEREARAIQAPDVKALTALAFAQLGQEQPAQALATYQRLPAIGPLGASVAAAGLGDLAAYEGRFGDAVRLLRAGAIDDIAAMRPEAAASKLTAAALAELERGSARAAVDAADDALVQSQSVKTRFLAARVFVEAGAAAKAAPIVASLAGELQAEPQAYAKILEGDQALAARDARQAVKALTEANTLLSTWIGHFDLGRAYLALNAFPQADSEFDRCLKRRGEAMSLFLDDEPTYAAFPAVHYYQGRVRQGLKLQGAVEAFRQYLRIRGASTDDPRVGELRRLVPGGAGKQAP